MDVELLFLGTGTSAGVPMIGCKCPVCTSTDPHDWRDRTSVVISYGQAHVLVDTSPELRVQCLKHKVDSIDAVVLTHAHADHIMGLDDLRRFNAIKGRPLDVWADAHTFKVLDRSFAYAFSDPDPDVKTFRPHLIRRVITGPFDIEGQTWTPIELMHGQQTIFGFRVGRLAYCTDVNLIPEKSFELLRDLDVLVLDALAPVPHAKHFSLEQAVEAARRIGAKQTLFTHMAHRMPHEETNRTLPANMQLAYDGQRVSARL